MQDFLLTLVVIFVLFKIFGRSNSSAASNYHFTQNNFNEQAQKKEGKVSVDFIPKNNPKEKKSSEESEYVDYEEVS
jgi:hypothetical protein